MYDTIIFPIYFFFLLAFSADLFYAFFLPYYFRVHVVDKGVLVGQLQFLYPVPDLFPLFSLHFLTLPFLHRSLAAALCASIHSTHGIVF